MKFKLFTFSILVAMGIPAHADDLAIAAKLEALGGKIGQKNGVVTEVSFRNSKELGADEFQIISELSGLRKLTVYGHAAGLNDETVGLLSKLKSLESLSVDGAQLSDAGLEKIADVKSLQSVSFFSPIVSERRIHRQRLLDVENPANLEKTNRRRYVDGR
ncbi:hypothetical protein OAL55_03730 [Verrucomicrobiales bacterium]|nr:hypothetical protein [Verrucomicrobiales bacterium]